MNRSTAPSPPTHFRSCPPPQPPSPLGLGVCPFVTREKGRGEKRGKGETVFLLVTQDDLCTLCTSQNEKGKTSLALPLHFTTQLPVPLSASVADLGKRRGRREASLALPLLFTTQLPVPPSASVADLGRGEGGDVLSALPLHFTTQLPIQLWAPVADLGEREGKREALLALLHYFTTKIPVSLSAPVVDLGRGEGGGRSRRRCPSSSPHSSPSSSQHPWPT